MRRAKVNPAGPFLALALLASALWAQEPQSEIFGQPAGWALEDDTALVSVAGGSELFPEPSEDAARLAILPESQLELLESQGSWAKVRYGDQVGWVDLDRVPAAEPLAPSKESRAFALEVDAGRLERALSHLGETRQSERLGPFELHTDVTDEELLKKQKQLAEPLLELFTERYGVIPVEAEQRGVIVLYASWRSYDAFNTGEDEAWIDRLASGHSVPGMAVFHAADERENERLSILVHELTHLLTWQALGVELPWWLEEGMAEDMSLAKWRRGRLELEPLGRDNLRFGLTLGKMFDTVLGARKTGRIPSGHDILTVKPPAEALEPHLYYAQVGFWVRFLLQDEGLAPRFRSYLAAIASGESAAPDALWAHLERPSGEILEDFEAWMRRGKKLFSSSKFLIQHDSPSVN